MGELFNYGELTLDGVVHKTAQTWRKGFTVPAVIILCHHCEMPVYEGYKSGDGHWYHPDCSEAS